MMRSPSRAFARRATTTFAAALIALPSIAIAATPATAATSFSTITVDVTTDTTTTTPCTQQPPTTTHCSLRSAIAVANAQSSPAPTITVPAATYVLTAGVLAINKPMTILGAEHQPGAGATTIDGGAKDRVFSVSATGVTIDGVVVRNGAQSKGNGGGILLNKNAVLTLTKSTVSGNSAAQGGGIEADGTLTVTQSTISANTASGKGGGLFNSSTATIQNSTFDGNSASGGGGIASPGTTNITATTVVNNNSNNSNGGGLYRNGGTFNVTSSIVASNNAGSGRDCYGSPNFTGANILQFTPGCNPTGATLLVTDPLLGPLANNGGATLTHSPLSTSKAINLYAQPCATPFDQRAVSRPQGSGATPCDVGSVEVQPLGVSVSLTTDTESIGAGTRHVPEKNVPASNIVTTNAPAGSTDATGMHFTAWHFTGWHFTGWHFTGWHFTGWHFTAMHFTAMHFTAMHFTGAEAVLKAAGLTDPLETIHLSDVTFNRPGGWEALLAGTAFAGLTREQISLADIWPIVENPQANITSNDIDFSGTSLASLSLPLLVVGGIPLKSIPLNAGLESPTATDQQRLDAWCGTSGLHTATQDPCARLNVGPGSSVTPLAVALAGFSLDMIDLGQIPMHDIATGVQDWLTQTPLMHFGTVSSPLSGLLMRDLPPAWVHCAAFTAVTCANATLADAANTENQPITGLDPAITLTDLFTNPATVGLPLVKSFSVADYLQAIIPPDLFPWQDVNLNKTSLQNASDQPEPAVQYIETINVTGDRAAATTTKLTLPPAFAFVPGSLTIDGQAAPDPTFDATNTATLNLGALNPGTHTVTMKARAGLTLGLEDCQKNQCAVANVTAQAGTDTVSATATKAITVTESFEQAGIGEPPCRDQDPCDTKPLDADTLLVGHISTPTDRDFYNFTVPTPPPVPPGAPPAPRETASIILSSLPADYDLVLYGPRPQQIGAKAPQATLQPVDDAALNLFGGENTLPTDTANDVALTPPVGSSALRIAANRGTVDERIDTGILAPGPYYVQVSGYNGANSPLPYLLRMSLSGVNPLVCAPPSHNLPDGSTLTDASTTYGTNPHVLFVIAQHRMYQTYGAASVSPMIAKLQTLAGSVGGTILAVDNPNNDATQTAANEYTAWDANHCDPNAANAVVHKIGVLIAQARDANPLIDSVVLIGDDSVLPMARIPDGAQLANEMNYADALTSIIPAQNGAPPQAADNELSSAMAASYFLSDNPYGVERGATTNDHELFVPDVALGRLVETPTDIQAAMQKYLDNSGKLDPSTASSALVSGYDFMTDTADKVATTLNNNGKRNVTELKGAWSGSTLTSNLLGASPPGIANFNGHFDQTHLLAGNGSDVVDSSVLGPDSGNVGKLSRRLLFSMGCHSGLSVSDVSVGSEFDWPQAVTGATQGGTFEGNTGFGYGDDTELGLGERLMALYAQALDGSNSVGQALMLAKQEYAATTAVLSPYDEKVLGESVFYGLPLYGLATTPTATGGTIHVLTTAAASGGSNLTLSGTDPRTHLNVAPATAPFPTDRVSTGRGDYYQVDGQKIMVQNRPIEPMTVVDATQANLHAHGFLVTSLSSTDAPITPKYFRPVVDESAELRTPTIGDAVFPATLSHVTHSVGANGGKDTVLITSGQARDPKPNGTVTQRLLQPGGLVEYSTVSDPDFTPGTIYQSRGEIVGTTAGFTVDTSGDIARVFVMYKATSTTSGAWTGVDLVATNLSDGTKQWWGGGPINGDAAEFFVQAVDPSGNIAFSTNKVKNFLAERLANSGALTIALQAPGGVTQSGSGWFNGFPITATISGGSGLTFSLDGADFSDYPSAGVSIPGDGVHHLLARDSAGDFTTMDVLIDSHGPTVTPSVNAGGANSKVDGSNQTWYDGPVTLHINANDGPDGSGVASISYHAGNAADTVVTDASNPALVRAPTGDASTDVAVGSTATYQVGAKDVAGNASTGTQAINIDTAPPEPHCTVPDPSVFYTGPVTVTCHPTDAGAGLLSAAQSVITLTASAPSNSQTLSATTGSVSVCDKFNVASHCTTIGPFSFKIDNKGPTVAATIQPGSTVGSAPDAAHKTWYDNSVNVQITASDGGDGSGVRSITYGATGAFVQGQTTVNSALANLFVAPAGDGDTSVSYSALDNVGNSSTTGTTGVAIDHTVPTFNCVVPNQLQWYTTNQTVVCTASDAGVGLNAGSPSSFSLVTSVPAGGQDAAASTGPQQLCDLLNHCVTAGPFTFEIDSQAPTVTITSPTDGAVYTPGQSVTASFACNDGSFGALTGTNCVGTQPNGATLDTTPGTHVFTVRATDSAHNVTTASVTYSVGFRVCYQYDTTKAQSTGGTVVLKVQLCDASGNNLSSPSLTLTAVAQDIPGPNPPRQLPSPNFQGNSNNGFDFRFSAGTYIYNLDPTQPLPDGVMLGTGPHTLYFVINHVEPPLYQAPFVLK